MKIAVKFVAIQTLLLLVLLVSFAVIFLNRDYLTPLTDISTNKPTSEHHPEPACALPTQAPPTVNPDGTKNYAVDLNLETSMTFEIGGSYFNSREYDAFTIATCLKEVSSDLLKQLRENNIDIVVIFLAITISSPLLVHYIQRTRTERLLARAQSTLRKCCVRLKIGSHISLSHAKESF